MAIENPGSGHWSGPIESLDDKERRSLLDSMSARPRPRIEIDEALRNGWFEMWYQPKIDLNANAWSAQRRSPVSGIPVSACCCPGAFCRA